jgi:branched-chain amino acid aminotransferase
LHADGLHAVTFPTPLDEQHPAYARKTLGQPHVPLAKQYALRNGCLEALFVNRSGDLVGTTEGFLFLVKDGAVIVAGKQPRDVTGFAVAALAVDSGFVVVEHAVRLPDLLAADEAFEAGAACGVIGIVRVDGKDVSIGTEGRVTRAIREAYERLTRGE